MSNKILLHSEGFAVFTLCIYMYGYYQFNWIIFLLLLFASDIAIFGYVFNNKLGATIYNLIHTYLLSIVVILVGLIGPSGLLAIGIIWTAHIGMDRMVGFGLKYPNSFKDTHLNRV